ncbi:MAG: zinc ribbon domain-containing protein [Sandaracinaceae bacterium]|nr:zinc ribbon domain-containing protein [Sandaracinaceae bacterium]
MNHGPTDAQSSGQAFPCPSCGAPEMTFDAAAQAMVCPFCRHQVAVAAGSAAIAERGLEEGMASAQRGLGVETRSITCSTCGASVSFTGQVTSTVCDFCGSPHVLQQESNRNLIRPESLVPFQVEAAVAQEKFRGWLAGLWFRPGDLKARAAVGQINGVYVPYWTFDARADSRWRAEAGYHYYVDEPYTDANGKPATRKVQKTNWKPADGQRSDRFDDVLVPASKGLPPGLAEQMKTFDTRRLVPYEGRYLAGWRAEEYGVDLPEGANRAAAIMNAEQERRCASDVPGDTHRNLHVDTTYAERTFKHVLLPLFIASYLYNQKTYRFLVNGQTGEVTGSAPYSTIKIVLFVLLILAILGGVIGAIQAFG